MLLHTGSNGQYIWVKDNIERIHANLLSQKTICTACNLNSTFVCSGLSLFVEAHHHHRSTIAHTVAGVAQKHLFTLLQRDAVDDGLALYTLQSSSNDLPLRGVDHYGYAGNIRLRGYQVEEGHHLLSGIE